MHESGIMTAMPRLLMYVRNTGCPDQLAARRYLQEFGVAPIEINISTDRDAAQMLLELVGSLSAPTFVVTDDDDQPLTPPIPFGPGQCTRNTDRGSVISEPSRDGLRAFLIKHGWLKHDSQPARA